MSGYSNTLIFVGLLACTIVGSLARLVEDAVLVRAPPPTAGIVHGEIVQLDDKWPWQAFIELDDGANQCGGTLIGDAWILTAAHCFDGGRTVTKIIMGTTRKNGIGKFTRWGEADAVCCHKDYDIATLDSDICLIKMKAPVIPSPTVRAVTLPTAGSQVADGTSCYVTGWGYDENGLLPDILQEATVKIVARQTCIDWHKPNGMDVVENTVCAGHEKGGADSCGGDSGGPLVCNNKGGFVLRGVTSYGPSYCGAAKSPGVYTDVSKYVDWIQDTMKKPCLKTHWSSWSGICGVTCGVGTITRTRTCLDEKDQKVDSSLCNGVNETRGLCIKDPCPTFSWGDWKVGSCSKTCGDAERTDKRSCEASNGTTVDDKFCIVGQPTRKVDCALKDCPIKYSWGPWGPESSCSVTCGSGVRTKTRLCLNSLGQTVSDVSKCTPGSDEQTSTCELSPCTGAVWGEWGPWSQCQATGSCVGISYSTRTCSVGGFFWFQGFCSGPDRRSRKCLLAHCFGTRLPNPRLTLGASAVVLPSREI